MMVKIQPHKENNLSNSEIGRLLKRNKQKLNYAIHTGTVIQKQQQKQNSKIYTNYNEVYSAEAHHTIYLPIGRYSGRRPKWMETDASVNWSDTKILKDKQLLDLVVEKAIEKFPASIVPCTYTFYNWIDSWIMQTKNISLLEKSGRKPRVMKGNERRNKKVFGTSIE